MAWTFGSARISENGNAGWDGKAKAGDQTSKELSTQSFYVHSKGWHVFRFKNAAYAAAAAEQMKQACANSHIGYDQSQRDTLWSYVKRNKIKNLKDVASNVETDCSALVRCIIYVVTGVDVSDVVTADMRYSLEDSGLFKPTMSYVSGMTLYTGDILCTKTSGHTGIMVEAEKRTDGAAVAPPTNTTTEAKKEVVSIDLTVLCKGCKGPEVKTAQRLLIADGYPCGPAKDDSEFGGDTEKAVIQYQKDHPECGKPDGIIGKKTWKCLLGA